MEVFRITVLATSLFCASSMAWAGVQLPQQGAGTIRTTGSMLDRIKAPLGILKSIGIETGSCEIDVVENLLRPQHYKLQAGEKNEGLNSYFQEQLDDGQCLSNAAQDFYSKEGPLSKLEPGIDRHAPRPLINEKAGAGRFSQLKTGSVWESALEQAGNNPRLALHLLGACGNDDITTTYKVKPRSGTVDLSALRDQRKLIRRQIFALEDQMNAATTDAVRYQIRSQIDALQEQLEHIYEQLDKESQSDKVICPNRTSALYVQGGLDASQVLPSDVQRRVQESQDADRGETKNIPAKAYHFTTGALIGCELNKCPKGKFTAPMVAKTLANYYRWVRLKDQNAANLKLKDDPTLKGLLNDDEAIKKLGQQSSFRQIRIKTDASTLMEKWFTFTADTKSWIDTMKSKIGLAKTPCNEPGWTAERCKEALTKLDSWKADIEWTSAQQAAGASFGQKACSQVPQYEMRQPVCGAKLQEGPAGTPGTGGQK